MTPAVPNVETVDMCFGEVLSQCTEDYHCSTYTCMEGICLQQPEGGCNANEECTSGICTNGKCARHEIGDQCRLRKTGLDDWCNGGSCNTLIETPVCDSAEEMAVGALCESEEHCASGLICSTEGRCDYDPNAVSQGGDVLVLHKQSDYPRVHQRTAEACGGNLVSITSEEENNEVKALLDRNGWSGAWIGAYAEANADQWSWTDGSPFGFSNWYMSYYSQTGSSAYYVRVSSSSDGLNWLRQNSGSYNSAVYRLPSNYADLAEATSFYR